ncbi:hypothetical protein LOC51_31985 [Rubrivivax sp. JA1024]|nr:hypothetical protein [Rubrivivax sp. JA1024]
MANENYEIIKRSIPHDATIHPTVKERFELATVIDCANEKLDTYRPEALREHHGFKHYYPHTPLESVPPSGKSEEAALPKQLPP